MNEIKLTDSEIKVITKKALNCISMYGDLRWCTATVCGCMGCANTKMSRSEYDIALRIPEVQEAIKVRKNKKDIFNNIYYDRVLPDLVKDGTLR